MLSWFFAALAIVPKTIPWFLSQVPFCLCWLLHNDLRLLCFELYCSFPFPKVFPLLPRPISNHTYLWHSSTLSYRLQLPKWSVLVKLTWNFLTAVVFLASFYSVYLISNQYSKQLKRSLLWKVIPHLLSCHKPQTAIGI